MSTKRSRKAQQRWRETHPAPEPAERPRQPTPRPHYLLRPLQPPVKSAEPPAPSLTQVEMIALMNEALGTSYPVPACAVDAGFLIDGLVDLERKRKRS